MKQWLAFGALTLCLVGAALPAEAALVRYRDEYYLQKTELVATDLYAAGGVVHLAGGVSGDTAAAGGSVFFTGTTSGDLLSAAGSLQVPGVVGDDARLLGGSVLISGTVHDDVVAAGGQLTIAGDASVRGDALLAGGTVTVAGTVDGDLRAAGQLVIIDGTVRGDVFVAAEELIVGSNARIVGDLSYRSPKAATMREGAQVSGTVHYEKIRDIAALGRESLRSALLGFFNLWIVLRTFMALLFAAVLLLLFPTMTRELVAHTLRTPWRSMLVGFILLVMLPVLALLCFTTLVGLPIGAIILSVYMAALILSAGIAPLFLGAFVGKLIGRSSFAVVDWKAALVGVALSLALSFVPLVGWVIRLAIVLVPLGALGHYWYRELWLNR